MHHVTFVGMQSQGYPTLAIKPNTFEGNAKSTKLLPRCYANYSKQLEVFRANVRCDYSIKNGGSKAAV